MKTPFVQLLILIAVVSLFPPLMVGGAALGILVAIALRGLLGVGVQKKRREEPPPTITQPDPDNNVVPFKRKSK